MGARRCGGNTEIPRARGGIDVVHVPIQSAIWFLASSPRWKRMIDASKFAQKLFWTMESTMAEQFLYLSLVKLSKILAS